MKTQLFPLLEVLKLSSDWLIEEHTTKDKDRAGALRQCREELGELIERWLEAQRSDGGKSLC